MHHGARVSLPLAHYRGHRPQLGPLSRSVHVLQTGRIADGPALFPFYAPVSLVQGGGVHMRHTVEARVLCVFEAGLER